MLVLDGGLLVRVMTLYAFQIRIYDLHTPPERVAFSDAGDRDDWVQETYGASDLMRWVPGEFSWALLPWWLLSEPVEGVQQ